MLGGIMAGFGDVGNVLLADFSGDAVTRLVDKTFGLKYQLGKLLAPAKPQAEQLVLGYGASRIIVGFAGPMLLRAVGIRLGSFGRWFRTINVAGGVAALTLGFR